MKPKFNPEGLKKARARDWLIRFVFGGVITACTGLIARRYGPSVGGLFLAFPAILPASLTLVKEHDGRAQAADDARGACLGAVALAAFAAAMILLLRWIPAAAALAGAAAVWTSCAVALWWLCQGAGRGDAAGRDGPR